MTKPTKNHPDRSALSAESSNQVLYALIDAIPTPVWLAGLDGDIVTANQAAGSSYGYRTGEWPGLNLGELFGFTHPEHFRQVLKDLASDGYVFCESAHRRKNGENFPGEARFKKLSLDGRELCVVSALDNSELQRADAAFRDSQAKFKLIFDQAAAGMATILPEGFFIQANPAFCDLLGFTPTQLAKLTFVDLTEPADRSLAEQLLANLEHPKQKTLSAQLRLSHRKKRPVWCDISLRMMVDQQGRSDYAILHAQNITAQREMEFALRSSEEKYRRVVEHVQDAIVQLDFKGRIRFANSAWQKTMGWSAEHCLGRPLEGFVVTRQLLTIRKLVRKVLQGVCQEGGGEYLCRQPSGEERWIEINLQRIELGGGTFGASGTLRDVTERRLAADVIEQERAFLQTVIDGVIDPILVIDIDRRVKMMNQAVRRDGALLRNETENRLYCYQVCYQLDRPCSGESQPCPMEEVLQTGEPVSVVHWRSDLNGDQRIFQVQASPLRDNNGEIRGIIESTRDITSLFEAEEQLREKDLRLNFLVEYDGLTGLPNRNHFIRCLRQGLLRARRLDRTVAVLHLGVDRFKTINESIGHNIGDQVLAKVARRLQGALRDSDLIARLAGDEFAIFLEDIQETTHIATVSNKLRQAIASQLSVDGFQLFLTISIGAAVCPEDGMDADSLMKAADIALSKAKDLGRNNLRFYTPDMNARSCEMLLLEHSLRRAIDEFQLTLHYQPQIDLFTGHMTGLEALVRWNHPERGIIPPGDFIPLAEETGLIVPLGEWVLREACRQNMLWQRAGYAPIRMAVNISARQFLQTNLAGTIWEVLEETGLQPDCLELEITESMIMEDIDMASLIMQQVTSSGVRLSIDDFGTGYSSLAHLKRFPLSRLKVDRSFVRDIANSEEDSAIVSSIIILAQSLNLKVVAEGIESEEQFRLLKEKGCEYGQGFLFSRPQKPEQLTMFLRRLNA